MQSAQSRHGNDAAIGADAIFRLAAGRRSLRQREMRPVRVVVTDVFVHQSFQVSLIHNDHMVEQIPAAVADPSFCNPVLLRTTETGSLRLDAEDLHRVDDFLIEVCTAIHSCPRQHFL
jgi:hypothetical protein